MDQSAAGNPYRLPHELTRLSLEFIECLDASRGYAPQLSLHREAICLIEDQPRIPPEVNYAIARLGCRLAQELLTCEKSVVTEPAFQRPVDEQNCCRAGHGNDFRHWRTASFRRFVSSG